jgi:hypothetical protein
MSKFPQEHSTSPKGEMRLSIRFGQREDGSMFMEYREENANDVEREAICPQCKENEAEQGSEYCTACLVMFAMLVHS